MFLSNFCVVRAVIFGTCFKILSKTFNLSLFFSASFSNSKSVSFSFQKYFSIFRPLSFLYSSIFCNVK